MNTTGSLCVEAKKLEQKGNDKSILMLMFSSI